MKLKSTILSVLVFLCALASGGGPTITPVVMPTGICQGDTIDIAILTSDTFVTGNFFTIELSDSSGSFANPVVLDTVTSQGNDTISLLTPTVISNSHLYRLKVVASDGTVGFDSTYLTIHHTPVVGFQLPQPSYCAYAYTVPLTGGSPAGGVYSGNFVAGSAFQAYLSDTGTFEVYYTYTDSIGCYAGDSTAIGITTCPAPSVSVQVNPAALCPGGIMSINIQTSDVIGSDNVFTIQLSDSSGSFSNATVLATDTNSSSNIIQIATPAEQAGTDYKVRVIASDPSTISVPFSVTFKNHLAPPNISLDTTGSLSLCGNDSFKLKVDSLHGISYQWTFNGVPFTVAKYAYEAKDSGLYAVSFTDTTAAGCSSGTASVFVGIYPYPAQPVVSPTGTVDYCGAGTVVLSTPVNNAVSFQWANDSIDIAGATQNSYTVDSTGVYLVEAVSANNCATTSRAVTVNIHPNPVVTFTFALDSFCLYSAPILLSGGSPGGSGGFYSGNYVTNNATFNQTLSGVGGFEIYYTYIDSIGCHGTDSTKIHVYDCTTSGINELTGQHAVEMFPNPASAQVHISTSATDNCQMKLFNLLGQEISSQMFNQQLTYSVEKLPAGVYMVEVSDISNTWRTVKRLVVQ